MFPTIDMMMNTIMKCRRVLPFLLLFGMGCAYFNTFYLARRNFNEGEQLRERNNGVLDARAKNAFNAAIKWSSEILTNYSDSRYVDDSLFIIGMSQYYQNRYVEARTKFDELLTYFPQSEFAPKATHYSALSSIELNQLDQAALILTELLDTNDRELRGLAGLGIARINLMQENWEGMLDAADQVIENDPLREQYFEAVYFKGEAFYQLERYTDAIETLTGIQDENIAPELRFEVNLIIARSYARLERYDEAMASLQSMQNRGEFLNFEPRIRLEVGNIYELQDNPEQAIATYTRLAGDFPNSVSASEAWYKIGMLLIRNMDNAEEAREAFYNVRQGRVPAGTSWYVDAQIKTVQTDTLLSKRALIERLEEERNRAPSGSGVIDIEEGETAVEGEEKTMEPTVPVGEELPDSLSTATADSTLAAPVVIDPAEKLAEVRFLLAELYTYSFDRPDLAMPEYRLIIEEVPESEYAVKSRYFLEIQRLRQEGVFTEEREKELMRELIVEYPRSEFVQDLKVYLGIIEKTPDEELFVAAEHARMLGNDAREYIPLYQAVVDSFPRTKNAYRARFLIAYAYEHNLIEWNTARSLYEALAEETPGPNSDQYIALAIERLSLFEREDELMEQIANNIAYYDTFIRELRAGTAVSGASAAGSVSSPFGMEGEGTGLTGLRKIRERNVRIRSHYFAD